jgi:CheY-like chemotaxis protein
MLLDRDESNSMMVLLVDDSPGDIRLTQEAFRSANDEIELHAVSDGVEAMQYLRREGPSADARRPDLILLDLNMPRMDGRQVLAAIKADEELKAIPTLILTTSNAETDIVASYQLHANCYLRKPVDLEEFEDLVESINDFWFWKKVKTMLVKGGKPIAMTVLLVEDNPGDVLLTREAFREISASIMMHVASDGAAALSFLRQEGVYAQAPRPDLILLDLHLPKLSGQEVLAAIKANPDLKSIPTLILSSSTAEADILRSYELHANCFMSKPVQRDTFGALVASINDFWLTKVRLARKVTDG